MKNQSGWRIAVLVALAFAALAVLVWDRMVHDVASSPTVADSLLANFVWLGSVVVLIAGPVLLIRGSVVPRPIRSAAPGLAAVAVLVVYCIGVFGFDWPRWPEVLNSDLEVVGVTYFVSAVVSSVSLFWWLQARRSGIRTGNAGVLGAAIAAGCVAMLSSAALVYFE